MPSMSLNHQLGSPKTDQIVHFLCIKFKDAAIDKPNHVRAWQVSDPTSKREQGSKPEPALIMLAARGTLASVHSDGAHSA